ncbi:hypothetical protein AAEX28_04390 [Lentisphaerota bacterium WC36G]|nr:hypothetical protein LJT99_07255 [Lentisphaerae bacterium WC36]
MEVEKIIEDTLKHHFMNLMHIKTHLNWRYKTVSVLQLLHAMMPKLKEAKLVSDDCTLPSLECPRCIPRFYHNQGDPIRICPYAENLENKQLVLDWNNCYILQRWERLRLTNPTYHFEDCKKSTSQNQENDSGKE